MQTRPCGSSRQTQQMDPPPLIASAQEDCNTTRDIEEDRTDEELSEFILRASSLPEPMNGGHKSGQTPGKYSFAFLPDFTQQVVHIYLDLFNWWQRAKVYPAWRGAKVFRRLVLRPRLDNASSRKDLKIPSGWLKKPSSNIERHLCHSILALEERMFKFTQLASGENVPVARIIFSVSEMNIYLTRCATDLGRQYKSLSHLSRTKESRAELSRLVYASLDHCCAWTFHKTSQLYGTVTMCTFQMTLSWMILSLCDSVDTVVGPRSQCDTHSLGREDFQASKQIKTESLSAKLPESSPEQLSVDELLRFTIINMYERDVHYSQYINMLENYWRLHPHEPNRKNHDCCGNDVAWSR